MTIALDTIKAHMETIYTKANTMVDWSRPIEVIKLCCGTYVIGMTNSDGHMVARFSTETYACDIDAQYHLDNGTFHPQTWW